MDMDRYGPFADTVVIVLALVATFSVVLLKVFGKVNRWTWLVGESPSFVVTGAIRALTLALMAVVFLSVDDGTYRWFLAGAVVLGVATLVLVVLFDRERRVHVVGRPILTREGQPLRRGGRVVTDNLVIGTEDTMREQAREDYAAAREQTRGLSLESFLAGYGVDDVYDTDAVWDRRTLSEVASRLSLLLMGAFLSGVLAVFVAALCIAVARK